MGTVQLQPGMERTASMRPQVFIIRAILGVIFGILLARFFFPNSGWWLMCLISGALVLFAYVFEYLHKKEDR